MRTAVVAALVAAVPPTVAALLTFLQARATNRRAAEQDAVGVARILGEMGGTIERIEATVERLDDGVTDLRERVARLEGPPEQGRRRLRA